MNPLIMIAMMGLMVLVFHRHRHPPPPAQTEDVPEGRERKCSIPDDGAKRASDSQVSPSSP